MAAASCSGSWFERTTSDVSLDGDCSIGKNIAGCGSSVRYRYFPSSTMPTTWMRVPSGILYDLPIALVGDPNILRANCGLITATRGAFLSSCHVKILPDRSAVPAVWKYSGDMLNLKGAATA